MVVEALLLLRMIPLRLLVVVVVALTTVSIHPQFLIQQQQTGVFPTIHQEEIYTVVRAEVSQATKKAQ